MRKLAIVNPETEIFSTCGHSEIVQMQGGKALSSAAYMPVPEQRKGLSQRRRCAISGRTLALVLCFFFSHSAQGKTVHFDDLANAGALESFETFREQVPLQIGDRIDGSFLVTKSQQSKEMKFRKVLPYSILLKAPNSENKALEPYQAELIFVEAVVREISTFPQGALLAIDEVVISKRSPFVFDQEQLNSSLQGDATFQTQGTLTFSGKDPESRRFYYRLKTEKETIELDFPKKLEVHHVSSDVNELYQHTSLLVGDQLKIVFGPMRPQGKRTVQVVMYGHHKNRAQIYRHGLKNFRDEVARITAGLFTKDCALYRKELVELILDRQQLTRLEKSIITEQMKDIPNDVAPVLYLDQPTENYGRLSRLTSTNGQNSKYMTYNQFFALALEWSAEASGYPEEQNWRFELFYRHPPMQLYSKGLQIMYQKVFLGRLASELTPGSFEMSQKSRQLAKILASSIKNPLVVRYVLKALKAKHTEILRMLVGDGQSKFREEFLELFYQPALQHFCTTELGTPNYSLFLDLEELHALFGRSLRDICEGYSPA